jgi:hypothetical protein
MCFTSISTIVNTADTADRDDYPGDLCSMDRKKMKSLCLLKRKKERKRNATDKLLLGKFIKKM